MRKQDTLNVHIHELPAHECKLSAELRPGDSVTVHLHEGDCELCPFGHCHMGGVMLSVKPDGAVFLTLENVGPINRITVSDKPAHSEQHTGPKATAQTWQAEWEPLRFAPGAPVLKLNREGQA